MVEEWHVPRRPRGGKAGYIRKDRSPDDPPPMTYEEILEKKRLLWWEERGYRQPPKEELTTAGYGLCFVLRVQAESWEPRFARTPRYYHLRMQCPDLRVKQKKEYVLMSVEQAHDRRFLPCPRCWKEEEGASL